MYPVEEISFQKHIRNRASALVNLLPFPHHYQNVLSAIANIDWQQQHQSPAVQDSLTYLQMAGVSSNATATAYLDWLEVKLRRYLLDYEQMINCHKREIELFIKEFR